MKFNEKSLIVAVTFYNLGTYLQTFNPSYILVSKYIFDLQNTVIRLWESMKG